MNDSETVHIGRKRPKSEKSWSRNVSKKSRNEVSIY